MIPKMTACLDAVDGGVDDGRHHRRTGAALGARRAVHQQGNRNRGGRHDATTRPGRMTRRRDLDAQLGTAHGAARRAARAAYLWDARGHALPRLPRRHRGELARPRAPGVRRGGHAQAATLAHVSNYFATPPQLALAARLKRLAGAGERGSRVLRATPAPRRTRRRSSSPDCTAATDRPRILALENAFHGRTMGALALTGKPAMQEPFQPMPGGVEHIDATIEALEAAIDDRVAALIVEPIKGEAGVIELPEGYLRPARALTERARRAAHRRRDPDRRRSHGGVVRVPARGHHPRRDHRRQGDRRRLPDRRARHLRRGERAVLPGHARLHVRRQPARRPPSPTRCSPRSSGPDSSQNAARARCSSCARSSRRSIRRSSTGVRGRGLLDRRGACAHPWPRRSSAAAQDRGLIINAPERRDDPPRARRSHRRRRNRRVHLPLRARALRRRPRPDRH